MGDGPASPNPDRAKKGEFIVASISRRDVVRQLAQSSVISILIKVANGALAYVMLLAIARVATSEQYGIFAVSFSVTVSVSLLATLGQPWVVTRFWPQWIGQNEPLKARAALRLSMITTALGLGAAVILLLLAGALGLIVELPWSFSIAAATALFTLAFGWSTFSSTGLRAQGFVVKALAPRDIAWRIGVCAVFGGAALAGRSFDAVSIVLAVAGILLVVIFPQIMMLHRSSKGATAENLSTTDRTILSRFSLTMCASAAVNLARGHGGVIIVSAFLGAETAGAYFVADRTANLLSFLLLAVNLVSGPLISQYYHSDRKDLVRIIVGLSGLMSGFTALTGLIFFFFFGTEVLALFNPLYGTFLPILLILCCGQFFIAATGPVGNLLNLSGYQRPFLILNLSVGIVTIALQAIGGFYYGAIGVASGMTAGIVVGSLAAHQYAWRTLGIDSSGLSLAALPLRKLWEVTLKILRPPR
jgi:O-antigen/teichoic acid export membrane protein